MESTTNGNGANNSILDGNIASTASNVTLVVQFDGAPGSTISVDGNNAGFNGTYVFNELFASQYGFRLTANTNYVDSAHTPLGGGGTANGTGLLPDGTIPTVVTSPGSPFAVYNFGNSTTVTPGSTFAIGVNGRAGYFYLGDLYGGTSSTFLGGAGLQSAGGVSLSSINGGATYVVGGLNDPLAVWNGILDDANVAIVSVSKVGTGTWVWTNDNANSGNTFVAQGILQIGSGGTTGRLGLSLNGTPSLVNVTSKLVFDRIDNITPPNQIVGTGSVEQIGTGTLTMNGFNTYTGSTIMTAGTIVTSLFGNAYSASSVGGGSTLATSLIFNGGTLQYNGNGSISDRNFSLSAQGGTFDVSGVSGNVASGVISSLSGGAPGVVASNTTAFANETVILYAKSAGAASNGVSVTYVTGAGSTTTVSSVNGNAITVSLPSTGTDNGLNVVGAINGNTAASALVTAYSAPLILVNPAQVGVSGAQVPESLTLSGNGTADIALIFADDGTGATSLNKTGTGVWTLEGTQLYSGLTTVSNGTFEVNGTLKNSNILVTGNGTLSNLNPGSFINTTVTVASGGAISPGGSTVQGGVSGGIINAKNVIFNSGGIYTQVVNAVSSGTGTVGTNFLSDLIHVTNTLTLNAGGLFQFEQAGTNTIIAPSGVIPMFQLDTPSNVVTSYGNLTWIGQPLGFTANFAALSGNANIIAVTLGFTPSAGFWTQTAPGGLWSQNANWDNGNAIVPNASGALAVFPAVQSGPYAVTVDRPFTAGNITFSGSNAYTISSQSSLATSLANANSNITYTANTSNISLSGANASAGNTIAIKYVVTPTGNVARSISTSGNIITVTLGSSAGVVNGTETATNIAAAINADATAKLLVSAAAQGTGAGVETALSQTNLTPSTLTLLATGAAALGTQGGTHTINSPLVLGTSNGTTVNATLGTQLNLLGNISDSSGNHGNVSIIGNGTVEMFGTNTYTGVTTIGGGTTLINSLSSLGTGGNLVLGAGTLQWDPTFTTGDISTTNGVVGGTSRNITIVGGNATFNVPTGLTATVSGNLGSGSTANVIKNGAGTLVLSGFNASTANGYLGTTIINQGLIQFSQLTNFGLGIGVIGNIDFNGGGVQWGTNSNTDLSQFKLYFDTNGATMDTNGNAVTLNNAIGGGGPGTLTKSGNGVLTLGVSSAQTLTGATIVNAGPTALAAATNTTAVSGGSLIYTAEMPGATGNSLVINYVTNSNVNASTTSVTSVVGNVITVTLPGTTGGVDTIANVTAAIQANATAAALVSVKAVGSGTLSSSAGSSTFSNGAGGGLSITNDNQLGAAPTISTTAALALNGGDLIVGSTPSVTTPPTLFLTGNRNIAIGNGTAGNFNGTFYIPVNTELGLNGKIINNGLSTGKLIIQGGGTLLFNADIANTYSGGTIINNSNIDFGSINAASTGAMLGTSGGILMQGNDTIFFNHVLGSPNIMTIDPRANVALINEFVGGGQSFVQVVRGSGNLSVTVAPGIALQQGADYSNFAGNLTLSTFTPSIFGAGFRVDNGNIREAIVNVLAGTALSARSQNTPVVGALNGQAGSFLVGQETNASASGTIPFQIGLQGVTSTFAGNIADQLLTSNGGNLVSINIVNGGTFVMTASNPEIAASNMTARIGLIKSTNNSDTLAYGNEYTGGTSIAAGAVLQLGDLNEQYVSAGWQNHSSDINDNGILRLAESGTSTNMTDMLGGPNSTIIGTGGLQDWMPGTVIVDHGALSNSYTGPTEIDAGTLQISVISTSGIPSTLGSSSAAANNLVLNGGSLLYVGTGGTTDRNFTIGNSTSNNGGTIVSSGTGALNFVNPTTGPAVVIAANSTHAASNSTGISGGVLVATAATLGTAGNGITINYVSGVTTTVSSVIGSTITVSLQNGNDTVSNITAAITANGSAAALVTVSGTPTGTMLSGTTTTLSGGAVAMAPTLTLDGSFHGVNNFAPAVQDVNGTVATSLNLIGSTSWNLQGINTYTGPTNVNNGNLVVTGSLASATVNVSSSSSSLLGNGTISGTVNLSSGHMWPGFNVVSDGAGLTAPIGGPINNAGIYTPNTLTVGNLNVTGGEMDFTFNPNGGNIAFGSTDLFDSIAVTQPNGLSLNAGTKFNFYTFNPSAIYGTNLNTPWSTTGFYNLFTFNGSTQGIYGQTAGLLNSANVTHAVGGIVYLFGEFTFNGLGYFYVDITTPPNNFDWISSVSGNWTTGSNWFFGVPGISGNAGVVAEFGPYNHPASENKTATVVTLDTNPQLKGLLFSSTNNYDIEGSSGNILTFNNGVVNPSTITVTKGNNTVHADSLMSAPGLLIDVISGSTLTLSGNLNQSAAGAPVTLTDSGTLVLSGNSNYTGGLHLNSGSLFLNAGGNSTASPLGAPTSALTFNGGITLDNTSGATPTNTTTITGGSLVVNSTTTGMGENGVTVFYVGGSGSSSSVTSVSGNQIIVTLKSGGDTAANVIAAIAANPSAASLVTASGTGTVTAGLSSTLAGGTNNAVTIGTNNPLVFNSNTVTFAGSSDLNFGTGAGTLQQSTTLNVTAGNLTIGGAIGDGSNGYGITVTGNGSLILGGTSTYTGATAIQNGNLTLGGNLASPLSMNGNSTLTLNAGAHTTGLMTLSNGTVGGAGSLANTSIVDSSNGTVSVSNSISGASANVTMNGTGTLTLSGTSTFGGGVTLANGTLVVNNPGALGSGTVTLNGGTLANTNNTVTFSSLTSNNAVTLNGTITFAGPQSLDLGTGAATMTSNTAIVQSSSSLFGIDGPLSANGFTLTTAGNGPISLGGTSYIFDNGTATNTMLTLGAIVKFANATISANTTGTGVPVVVNGTVTMNGTNSLTTNGQIDVGHGGAGVLNFNGSLNAPTLFVGNATDGTVNMTTGTMNLTSTNGNLALIMGNGTANSTVVLGNGTANSATLIAAGIAGANATAEPAILLSPRQTNGVNAQILFAANTSNSTLLGAGGKAVNITFNPVAGSGSVSRTISADPANTTNIVITLASNNGIVNATETAANIAAAINSFANSSALVTAVPQGTGNALMNSFTGQILDNGGTGTSTLVFNGGVLVPTATNPGYFTNLSTVKIGLGGLTINTNGTTLGLGQQVLASDTGNVGAQNDGGLTINGGGTVNMTSNVSQTYTGNTNITNATLVLGNGLANNVSLSSGNVFVNNLGVLDTVSQNLTTNVTVNSGGVMKLEANSVTNGTTLAVATGGQLLAVAATPTINSAVSVASGATFQPGPAPTLNSGITHTTINGTFSLASGALVPVYFDTSSPNIADTINLIGGSATNFSGNATDFNLFQSNGGPFLASTGTNNYTLITSLNGVSNVSNFVWSNEPTFGSYSYTFGVVTGNTVQISITDSLAPNQWVSTTGGTWGNATAWSFVTPNSNETTLPPDGVGANFTVLFAPGITTASTVTLDGNRTVGGATFTSTDAFTIAVGNAPTNTLTFDNGTVATANLVVAVGNDSITAPVAVTGNSVLAINVTSSGSTLTMSGGIKGTADKGISIIGNGLVILSGNNSYVGNTTMNAGTLILSGNNTLTSGNLFLNSGNLFLANATALGSGPVVVNGGNIDNSSGSPLVLTGTNTYTLNSNLNFLGSSNLTLGTGNMTINQSTNISVNGSILTLTGNVLDSTSGASVFNKTGTGTLILKAGSSNISTTEVSAGTLVLSGGTNRLPATTTLELGDGGTGSGLVVLGDGNGVANQTLSNLLVLGTGTSNAIQGGNALQSILTVSLLANATVDTYSGVLGLGTAYTTVAANELALTKIGNGTLVLTGNNTYLGNTTINRGTIRINGDNNLGVATATVTLGNNTAPNSTLELAANNTTTTNRAFTINTTTSNFTVDANSILTLGATSSITTVSASDNVNKNGTGTLVLGKSYTYTAGTNVLAGTVQQNVVNALPTTSALSVSAGATFAMNGFAANIASLSGAGNVTMGGLSGNGNLTVGGANTATTFTGNILGNTTNGTGHTGDGNFVKIGTGNLTLAGTNTFTGQTNITAGTLTVNSSLALQFSDVNYNNGDGTLAFGSGVTAVTMAELLGNKDLVLTNTNGTAQGVVLTQGGDNGDNIFSGNLSGLGALFKLGSGTLTLSGNLSQSQALTVNNGTVVMMGTNNTNAAGSNVGVDGTLTVGDNAITPSLSGNLANNGSVNFNESFSSPGTITYAGNISGNGSINVSGASISVNDITTGRDTNITSVSITGSKLVLSGISTTNGSLTVGGGLVVTGNVPAAINIGSGGYLGGNGTVGAPGEDVNVSGGVLAPGFAETLTFSGTTANSIVTPAHLDTLTVGGNLVWNPSQNSPNIFHLSNSGNTSDRINVLGNVTYAGDNVQTIVFDFQDTGFYDGVHPETYTLLTASNNLANLGFSLSQFQAQDPWKGGNGRGSYFIFAGGGTQLDFVLIPEPSTYGLVAGGAMLLLGLRRKRKLAKAAKAERKTQA